MAAAGWASIAGRPARVAPAAAPHRRQHEPIPIRTDLSTREAGQPDGRPAEENVLGHGDGTL